MHTPLKPISLQLYTLRAESKVDFPAVLRRVAEIGYKGVEPAGFYGLTPKEFRAMVEDLGMQVSSTHSPWARPETLDEAIEVAGVLGVKLVAGGFGASDFSSLDAIQRTAGVTNQIHAKLAAAGLTLVIHNHAWEFEKIDGRIKHEIFAELCPEVSFELDTYWAANFGENDPVEMLRRFAHRSPLLHIKDGPLVRPNSTYNEATNTLEAEKGPSASLLALGRGKNDIKGIIAALDPAVTQWLVVEQDNSDTDMFECVAASYRYLVDNNLGLGNVA